MIEKDDLSLNCGARKDEDEDENEEETCSTKNAVIKRTQKMLPILSPLLTLMMLALFSVSLRQQSAEGKFFFLLSSRKALLC